MKKNVKKIPNVLAFATNEEYCMPPYNGATRNETHINRKLNDIPAVISAFINI